MFSMRSVSWNPLIAIFRLSSADSLNLGTFQNGVIGNGLRRRKSSALKDKSFVPIKLYHGKA